MKRREYSKKFKNDSPMTQGEGCVGDWQVWKYQSDISSGA